MDAMEDRLLTPGEVAKLFRVDAKTVTRWGEAGKLESVKTPGGHHRFWQSEIVRLLAPPSVNTDPLRDLAVWLVSLDTPAGERERRTITLSKIIDRARQTLAEASDPEER